MRVGQDSGIRLKLRQSRVGLGCSRLGSLLEGSDETMLDLLRGAYGVGARVFDTADIYGQGASERILGQFLSSVDREDIVVITKVGQVFPLHLRLLIPFKKFVRFFLTMLSFGKELAGRARQRELGRDFSKPHIVEGLQSSLKRLGVSWVDILLLHSPASSVLRDGAALQTLGWLKSEGRIRLAGVSCDDVETAALAASDPRVDVIQIPLSPENSSFAEVARQARDLGVLVIAREVLGGVRPASEQKLAPDEAFARVQATLDRFCADLVLVGSTNRGRFCDLVSRCRQAEPAR